MDIQIVIMGMATFFLFLIAIAVFFRIAREDETLSVLLRAFLVTGATCAFFTYQNWGVIGLVGATTIYILLSVLFIFGIFGVIEASITLRILAEIARGGDSGLPLRTLSARYNRDVILKKRISMFVATGELEQKGNRYYKTVRLSYFRLREHFLKALRMVFPSS